MTEQRISENFFMDTGLTLFANLPYKVKDMSGDTVRYGRKEMDLALHEMPGLAALREEYAGQKPLGLIWKRHVAE